MSGFEDLQTDMSPLQIMVLGFSVFLSLCLMAVIGSLTFIFCRWLISL